MGRQQPKRAKRTGLSQKITSTTEGDSGSGSSSSSNSKSIKEEEMEEEVEVVSCEERFPMELWKIIIDYLYFHANFKELLQCRFVCKPIKALTEQVLKTRSAQKLWKPTFVENNDWKTFVSEANGTRLRTPREITRFLTDMESISSPKATPEVAAAACPFPNGTIILSPVYPKLESHIRDIYADLRGLINKFGDHINCLVFSIREEYSDVDVIMQILNILNLKNLKSLVIQKQGGWYDNLSSGAMKLLLELGDFETMNRLVMPAKPVQLQIYGVNADIFIRNTLVAFGTMMGSLKQLSFTCTMGKTPDANNIPYLQSGNRRFKNFMRLEKLKITEPTLETLDIICSTTEANGTKIQSTLKEMSVRFHQNPPPATASSAGEGAAAAGGAAGAHPTLGKRVGDLFLALDERSESLELLHLDISPLFFRDLTKLHLDPIIDDNHYPKMKHFVVKLSTIKFWNSLMEKLMRKFKNLKKLTILMGPEELRYKTPKGWHEYILNLWETLPLPSTVEVVQVPYFGWRLKRGQSSNVDFRFA